MDGWCDSVGGTELQVLQYPYASLPIRCAPRKTNNIVMVRALDDNRSNNQIVKA
jgi:hypothetical protein